MEVDGMLDLCHRVQDMLRLRGRHLIASFLSIASLLAWESGFRSPVLCVHADGSTALETGAERCCLSAQKSEQPPGASAMREADTGRCPGCQDVFLASAAPQPSRSSSARPMALAAVLPAAAPATRGARAASTSPAVASKAVSPPGALPLRV